MSIPKLLAVTISALLFSVALPARANDSAFATLDIRGMDCAGCPITVKQVLKKIPGVNEVSVDYKTRSAQVKFDPGKTAPEQLAKAVTDIGYPATVKK